MRALTDDPAGLLAKAYAEVRAQTEALAAPLSAEDQLLQSMPDASPTKWHRAHTSWFFETFVLARALPDYRPFHPRYGYLFNSYYNAIGERHERPRRGMLSRPPLEEIAAYRRHVDAAMAALFEGPVPSHPDRWAELAPIVALGINHEQQHQELLLTDILHAFASQPLRPAYRARVATPPSAPAPPLQFLRFDEGLREIGHPGGGFCFDNEGPRHRVFLEAFELGSRLVTCGEFRAFIEAGGYQQPELWLSEGWDVVRQQGWRMPLYWEEQDGGLCTMTLAGPVPIDDAAPVCHVSYFEADAYAHWAGARLPTEAEWEVAAASRPAAELEAGNLLETGALAPVPARGPGLTQLFGDVWEWTRSPYSPYPGYRPAAGALGEYNGKFMVNQQVLRGGSCVTPRSHLRTSYRNFFPPGARWQFMGLRLARDA